MRKILYILGLLSEEDMGWIDAVGERVAVPDGQQIIREGTPVGALFLLVRGQLRVTAGSPPQVLATLGPGEILGEVSFVDSRPPTATVAALGPSVVLRIEDGELRAKLAMDEGFASRFYRAVAVYLAQRLRSVTLARQGGGNALSADTESADELSPEMLDELSLAGKRVEWLLTRHAN